MAKKEEKFDVDKEIERLSKIQEQTLSNQKYLMNPDSISWKMRLIRQSNQKRNYLMRVTY